MFMNCARMAASACLLAGLARSSAHAQTSTLEPVHTLGHRLAAGSLTAIDANLYTQYSVTTPYQSFSWVRCGATAQSEGCFGGGGFSGFSRICAMIDGKKKFTKKDVVTHDLYVLDGGATGSDPVSLNVYKFTDTISGSYDTTTAALVTTIPLPLKGGSGATCSMAANSGFIYIGTSASDFVTSVDKKTYGVAQLGGFSPSIPVSKITADDRGYVFLQFAGGNETGYYVISPDGAGDGDGGGTGLIPNTITGTLFP